MKEIIENFNKTKDNRNGDVITFDFDQTVVKSFLNKTVDGEEEYQFGGVNKEIIKRIKSFKQAGKTVFIVTSRQKHLEDDESSVKSLLNRLKIEVDAVFYTEGEPKAQKLYELGSTLHYDDDPKEHEAIEAYKNLHKNFEITVKYPDDLLKDIDAVSKGVILTADGKILIAQRSDSFEWDAPGGHIMQGEEANFSFWREVKEELGLEVSQVQFLDKTQTTWKDETKDTYYFFGRTDYILDELEGVLNLQWEISDYFCGDWEEVQRKTKGNRTQHLDNVMNLLFSQQELLESQQPHSKNHKVKKRRIIGLGGSKTTGAKGLEKVTDFSRSKSAPPGFGVLEEENDEKPPKTYKIKIKSTVEEKKKRKKKKKQGIYGGKYYDLSFLDKNTDNNDDPGEE